jgi:hypothetical protein
VIDRRGEPVVMDFGLAREVQAASAVQTQQELVGERFEYAPGNPRMLDLPGLGRRVVWDMAGRRQGSAAPTH